MDIDGRGHRRKSHNLIPGPRHRRIDSAVNGEAPLIEGCVWGRPGRQDWKVWGHILPGRNAGRIGYRAPSAAEAATDRRHGLLLTVVVPTNYPRSSADA